MRLIIPCILFLFIALNTSAQEPAYTTSDAVSISKEGFDKLLQMRNGNTVLFHFEYRKPVLVKIFDAQHKEIASQKHVFKIADVNAFDRSDLYGVYDINGEAVLFFEQDVDNRATLMRLRFDAVTGKLISEAKAVQSESFAKETITRLLKNRSEDNYYIVSAKVRAGFVEEEFSITAYNGKHEIINTVPLVIDQKGYDNVKLTDAAIDRNNGVFVTVVLSKIVQYPATNEPHMVVAYLPAGANKPLYKKAQLPDISGLSMRVTHNTFANKLNFLFTLEFIGEVKNIAGKNTITLNEYMLMVSDEAMAASKFIPLYNVKAQGHITSEIDTNQFLSSFTRNMYTNQFGLTTVIYEGMTKDKAKIGMPAKHGVKHNITFTQFDDMGKEIYGAVFPVSRLRTHNDYKPVFHFNSDAGLCSKDCFNTKNNFYVTFNEVDKNYNIKLSQQQDSIYNTEFTNAVYYKLNKKREVTEAYLLGKPADNEYKHIYARSGDFDEQTNTYATLYLHKKGETYTTHIAWVKFD